MIDFHYETDFSLDDESRVSDWVISLIRSEGFEVGEIVYVFCGDEYLQKLNVEFLNHDTLTDILSFDYTMGKLICGEIYISVERVLDNSNDFNTDFEEEMRRVIIHGILHFCGYKDKSITEKKWMRKKENDALLAFLK